MFRTDFRVDFPYDPHELFIYALIGWENIKIYLSFSNTSSTYQIIDFWNQGFWRLIGGSFCPMSPEVCPFYAEKQKNQLIPSKEVSLALLLFISVYACRLP
jgi:hypothetical protein